MTFFKPRYMIITEVKKAKKHPSTNDHMIIKDRLLSVLLQNLIEKHIKLCSTYS